MAESMRRQRNRYILRQLFIHGAEDFVPFIQLAKAIFAAILFASVLEIGLTIDFNAERDTFDSDSPCMPQGTADPFCLPQHTVVFECMDYKIERVAAKNQFQVEMYWTNITSESAYFLEKDASTGKVGTYKPLASKIGTNKSRSWPEIQKRLPYLIEVVKTKDSKCKHTYLLSCTKLVNEIRQMSEDKIIEADNILRIEIERTKAILIIGIYIILPAFVFIGILCKIFVDIRNKKCKYGDVGSNSSEAENSSTGIVNDTETEEETFADEDQHTEQEDEPSSQGDLHDWAIM